MVSEDSKKNRIMDYAFKKFSSAGIAHVTMDEISRGVGIGKGTLYKFFPSKELLLMKTIDFYAGRIEKAINELVSDPKLTPVDKLNLLLKTVSEKVSVINASVLTYLERSMPEAYEKIIKTRERIILSNFSRLFEEGKTCGMVDPQVDEFIVTHIIIGAVNHITQSDILSGKDTSLERMFRSVTNTILKGCLTEEGRKLTEPVTVTLRS